MVADINDVLKNTDWKLLREQKAWLLEVSTSCREMLEGTEDLRDIQEWTQVLDNSTGLVNWIDQIQDAAVDSGLVPEHEVFETGEN